MKRYFKMFVDQNLGQPYTLCSELHLGEVADLDKNWSKSLQRPKCKNVFQTNTK